MDHANKPIARIDIPGLTDRRHGTAGSSSAEPERRRKGMEVAREVVLEDKLRATLDLKPEPPVNKMLKGVVVAAEERIKIYEDIKNKRARRKMMRNLVESIIWLLLLAIVVGGYFAWQNHRVKITAERARIAAEAEAERLRLMEERNRIDLERRERERLAREAAAERERFERAQREKAAQEARERVAKMRRDNLERYQMFTCSLSGNKFDLFWKAATNGLETAGGELCYLFPQEGSAPPPLYWVVYETNGVVQAFRLDSQGEKEGVAFATFSEKLKNADYLVARGDKVYFKSKQKDPKTGVLSKKQECDPATLFFGGLTDVLKWLKPTYDELTFDVVFTTKGGVKRIVVENLEFGCAYSLPNVRAAIEKEFPFSSTGGGGLREKRFKRTVKLWNGGMIKQGIDGITYVPRTRPPQRTYNNSTSNLKGYDVIYRSSGTNHGDASRWQALYNRAVREEADERAFYERQRAESQGRRARALSEAERTWREKIDKIFDEGTLSYRIRKRKPAN